MTCMTKRKVLLRVHMFLIVYEFLILLEFSYLCKILLSFWI